MKFFTEYKMAKAFYFTYLAAAGPIHPFLAVIAKGVGFSTLTAGTLLTIATLLSIVAEPVFGSLADKFLSHRLILLTATAIDGMAGFSLQFFPPAGIDRMVTFECSSAPRVLIERKDALSNLQTASNFVSAVNGKALSCQLSFNSRNFDELGGSQVNITPFVNPPLLINATLHYVSMQMGETVEMNIDLPTGSNELPACISPINVTASLYCDNPILDSIIVRRVSNEVSSYKPLFWIFSICVILNSMGCSLATSISGTICLKQLGEDTGKYAYIKVFGSVTWGMFGLLGGVMADWYSHGEVATDFTLNCYISLFFYVLTLIVEYNLKCEFHEKPKKMYVNLKILVLRNPHFIAFIAMAIMSGCFMGLVTNFLNWFIEDIADESGVNTSIKSLEGIVLFVQTVAGEIPFLLISGHLLRWIGHVYCFSLIFLAYGIRFIYYYFLSNPWWIIPVEILNGLTNATYKVAAATYAFELALPGTEATVIGIASAAFDGIGYSLGAFLGGVLIDAWGMRVCFLVAGIFAIISAILNSVLQLFLHKISPRKSKSSGEVEGIKY